MDDLAQVKVRSQKGTEVAIDYYYVENDFAGPITEIASGLQRATASARSGTPYKDRDTSAYLKTASEAAKRFSDSLKQRSDDHARWYENRPHD